jgi:hypothetical protein
MTVVIRPIIHIFVSPVLQEEKVEVTSLSYPIKIENSGSKFQCPFHFVPLIGVIYVGKPEIDTPDPQKESYQYNKEQIAPIFAIAKHDVRRAFQIIAIYAQFIISSIVYSFISLA